MFLDFSLSIEELSHVCFTLLPKPVVWPHPNTLPHWIDISSMSELNPGAVKRSLTSSS